MRFRLFKNNAKEPLDLPNTECLMPANGPGQKGKNVSKLYPGCHDREGHLEAQEDQARQPRVAPHLHVQAREQGIVEVTNFGAVLTERPGEAEDDSCQRHNVH